jgi:peptide-methionine (S)-S-oxide reductase
MEWRAVGLITLITALGCWSLWSLQPRPVGKIEAPDAQKNLMKPSIDMNQDTLTLGAGCFWCVEAVFASLKGVDAVVSGYMGGHIKNPAYREVCTGRTGHAEVVQVVFQPNVIDVGTLLDVFFATHDPTTLNRQGADVGSQYRSAIFYAHADQLPAIEAAMIRARSVWRDPIVTEVLPMAPFYPAEDYHQAYYELNGEAPYCRAVIAPKMKKLKEQFAPLLSE